MVMTARAADYRSVAGSVHTQLVGTRLNEREATIDDNTRSRLNTVKELLQVGQRYAPKPDGSLDHIRSATPEKLTLANNLIVLVPQKLAPYRDQEPLDMQAWTKQAVSILETLEAGKSLSTADEAFTKVELEGFLENLLSLPPELPERFGRHRLWP